MMGWLRPHGPDRAHQALCGSYQCALCHHLGAEYGFAYRLLAGPDLVFYNLFLDMCGAGPPPASTRACVLAPGVTRLPCRETTAHTRLAAAFGVWMAVLKLEDDRRDEGGPFRWLAWRAFAAGGEKARATLLEAGFPVAAIEALLRDQAAIESGGPLPLADAAAPTAAISALAFGVAGPGADAIGDGIGRYLFYADNLLDQPRDDAAGGYNALSRVGAGPAEALEGARAAIRSLDAALDALPLTGDPAWLRKVLVVGFSDKLRRWERLPLARRAGAELRDLVPRVSLLARQWALLGRQWVRVQARAHAVFALTLAWLFPRAAWAERWWPDDTGALQLDDTGALRLDDTGASAALDAAADTATTAGDQSPAVALICDGCWANCGWCDAEGCFGACCGDTCDSACNDACSDACSGG